MNYPEPIFVSETTSTNNYLADLCDRQNQPDMTTVYTTYQSAGRGQRGNTWESEAGANLLFSFVVFPEFLEARRQFLLSQVTALALQEVLSAYTPDVTIKWPNDIYWKRPKTLRYTDRERPDGYVYQPFHLRNWHQPESGTIPGTHPESGITLPDYRQALRTAPHPGTGTGKGRLLLRAVESRRRRNNSRTLQGSTVPARRILPV